MSESDSNTSDSVALESEKKATSAPEIKAERINNKNNTAKLISSKIFKLSIKLVIKNVGSGSNYFLLN
ncbi:hypothetical protein GCM10007963_23470 [Lutibacter litoralis]|nr:hypothetical protein GCM10007963_23470 [Lutibacter litoralis]